MEFDVPDSAANTTMTLSPTSTVRFAPNRAVNAPVSSMKNTCTKMYELNSMVTWLGVASRPAAIDLRMGSTRPIPMKAITAANAVTQTARGCPLTAWSRPCCGPSCCVASPGRADWPTAVELELIQHFLYRCIVQVIYL
jgi:hypothetical protein